jgi:hypothetical protein
LEVVIGEAIMSKQGRSGGIRVGNVGRGDVTLQAGGDIIGGNKTTTTTIGGFRSDDDKQRFQHEIEALRELLREMKGHIEASSDVSADDKDELGAEILEYVRSLKVMKEGTAPLTVGQAPPASVTQGVESHLDKASTFLDKLQAIARKSAGLAATVGGLIARSSPLLLSLRGLFGLA